MKTEFTIVLNELFRASGKGYKDVETDLGFSERTFRRWLSGDTEPTISVFYKVVEYFGGNKKDVQARIGMAALDEWEKAGFKNAKELMEEHAIEKARIHQNYETRIITLVEQSDKRQKAFEDALTLIREQADNAQKAFTEALTVIGEQYRANADYLIGVIRDNEEYIRDLLAKTEHSNAIAIAEQKRAEDAENRAKIADERADSAEKENRTTRKKMYMLFSGMLVLVILLVVLLALGIVLDLPTLGMGNG